MADYDFFKLFDSFWFEHSVFSNDPIHISHPLAKNPAHGTVQRVVVEEREDSKPLISPSPALLRVRSRSVHELSTMTSFSSDSLSLNSVLLTTHKLQTIVSSKEAMTCEDPRGTAEEEKKQPQEAWMKKSLIQKRRRKKERVKGSSRSLSDLEFEELKGFMDVGFVFTEEDAKDSSLALMIPGLQRLARKKEGEEKDGSEEKSAKANVMVSRPYLSEAWDFLGGKNLENPLMKFRIPSLVDDRNMKDRLRFWAYAVASTVDS